MTDNINAMINAANEKNPVTFRNDFIKSVTGKLNDKLTAKKMEIGQNMFQPPSPIDGVDHPLADDFVAGKNK